MTRHIYSTYALLIMISIVLTIAVFALFESEDMDELCNTENATLKRIHGAWNCSVTHYAQGWYHNASNPIIISISATETYYNITGFEIDKAVGFLVANNSVEATKDATFRLIGTASFYGGNQGDYEWELFINGVETPACAWHRTTSSTAVGDASMSCIVDLKSGDSLNIRVEDLQAPAQNVNIEAINFNIMEVQ